MKILRLRIKQQGQISLLLAGMAFVFIACAVMALDTGRLYLERQRLQSQADMAALEVAAYMRFNAVDASDEDLPDELLDVATLSAQYNGFAVGMGNISINRTACSSDAMMNDDMDDVFVRLTRTVPDSLVANLAVLWPGSGFDGEMTLEACAGAGSVTAIGAEPQWVAFTGSGNLLRMNCSGPSSGLSCAVLQDLLGSSVDLAVLGPAGLVDTAIELKGIAQGLGLDLAALSADALINTNVTALALVDAAISVLSDQLTGAQLSALNQIYLNGGAHLGHSFLLGDILRVDDSITDRRGALNAEVMLLPLLEAAVMASNRDKGVSIKDLNVNLGQLATVDLELGIISPPVLKVGPAGCLDGSVPPCVSGWLTESTSAQLELGLDVKTDVAGLAALKLDIDISAAEVKTGIAQLTSAGDGAYDITVEGLGSPLVVSTTIELALLPAVSGLLGLRVDGNERDSTYARLPQSETVTWPAPRTDPDWPVVTASLSTGVDDTLGGALADSLGNLSVSLRLLGIDLGLINLGTLTANLLNGLTGLVSPLTGVLDALLEDLDIAIGTIDVPIYNVDSPETIGLID